MERKVHDVNSSQATHNAGSATVVPLSLTAQGTDNINRVGDSIKAISLSFKYYLQQSTASTAGEAQGLYRLTIFRDADCDGGVPLESDVFQNASRLMSPYKKGNTHRFTILLDKYIEMNIGTRLIHFESFFKEMDVHMKYDGPTSAIADATTNHVFFMIRGVSNASTSSTLYYDSRLSYVDN